MLFNNPAARLHQVLSLCRKHGKDSGGRLMLLGWRKVLRMSERAEDLAVLNKLHLVYQMPGQIAELVGRHPDLNEHLYLGWMDELQEAISKVCVESEFRQFVSHVPKTLLVNLEFCALELEKRFPEIIVNEDNLTELKLLAQEFFDELVSTELEAPLRFYLLDHTGLIVRAVRDYLLTGSPALQNAVDAAMGTVVTQRKVALASREHPLGERFWNLVGKASVALQMARSPGEIGDAAFKSLSAKQAA